MKHKVVCVIGTRPEVIKMAPIVKLLKAHPCFDCRVVVTAQHRGLLDQALAQFDIQPDIDLDTMQPDQTLAGLTSRLLSGLDGVLRSENPAVVLAQGDTTTVMSAALASFYLRIPFGHVEAGLRTFDLENPFPEEANRLITSRLTRWHFAPTQTAVDHLLAEGVDATSITLTGNTVIDALLMTCGRNSVVGLDHGDGAQRLILVTAHRRENFGQPLVSICRALQTLVARNPDIRVLYSVHPNPHVREVAYTMLGSTPRIELCEPMDYASFVAAMQRAYLIISDSGGVQEEAPALGKPVLVLRTETERPEAVATGAVKLVGTNTARIVDAAQALLDCRRTYEAMAGKGSPYGDGRSAQRIVDVLAQSLWTDQTSAQAVAR